VRCLLSRCLEKDLKKRLRDAGDASLLLDDNPVDARSGAIFPAATPATAPAWRLALPWGLTAVLAAALVTTVAFDRRASSAPASPIVLSAKLPPDTSLDIETNQGEYPILAITRDGSKIAFVAGSRTARQIYVRAIDKLEATPVPRSEGAAAPFFSPDGHWIGFFARGKLKKASVDGGDPIELADSGIPRGGVWCDDGTIVFSPSTTSGLVRIPSGGGSPTPVTTPDPARQERTHRFPALLPHGEVAFTVGTADKSGTYEDSRIDGCAESGKADAARRREQWSATQPRGIFARSQRPDSRCRGRQRRTRYERPARGSGAEGSRPAASSSTPDNGTLSTSSDPRRRCRSCPGSAARKVEPLLAAAEYRAPRVSRRQRWR
jgi:serine/threonine-protein kinase